MSHIPLPPLPGMPSLSLYRPDIAALLHPLADQLLHKTHPSSTLSLADREIIATYVSSLNQCKYCTAAHGSVAAAHLCMPVEQAGSMGVLISSAQSSYPSSPANEGGDGDGKQGEEGAKFQLTPKMHALLIIASAVTGSGKDVTTPMVQKAKEAGATDMDVHDTVLIAAAFCMFNRYVDGLGTAMPSDERGFGGRGEMIKEKGYVGILRAMGERKGDVRKA